MTKHEKEGQLGEEKTCQVRWKEHYGTTDFAVVCGEPMPCKIHSDHSEEKKDWEDWEESAVGKNIHSVYVHCLACKRCGVNFPLEKQCGNCGNKTDAYTYYDAETVSVIIREKLKEEREKWQLKNVGLYRQLFGEIRDDKTFTAKALWNMFNDYKPLFTEEQKKELKDNLNSIMKGDGNK